MSLNVSPSLLDGQWLGPALGNGRPYPNAAWPRSVSLSPKGDWVEIETKPFISTKPVGWWVTPAIWSCDLRCNCLRLNFSCWISEICPKWRIKGLFSYRTLMDRHNSWLKIFLANGDDKQAERCCCLLGRSSGCHSFLAGAFDCTSLTLVEKNSRQYSTAGQLVSYVRILLALEVMDCDRPKCGGCRSPKHPILSQLPTSSNQMVDRVSAGFSWFQLVSAGFSWFQLVSAGFSWFQLVSAGFSWFQLVSAGFSWFQHMKDITDITDITNIIAANAGHRSKISKISKICSQVDPVALGPGILRLLWSLDRWNRGRPAGADGEAVEWRVQSSECGISMNQAWHSELLPSGNLT